MDYAIHIAVICGVYVILVESLNLLVGYTGLPALGHGAFSCVGGYLSALLALRCGLSPWLSLLVGAVGAAIVGLAVSLPTARLRGDYLALATFGFSVIVHSVVKNWVIVTRGPLGLPGIPMYKLFGVPMTQSGAFLPFVIVIAIVATAIVGLVVGSPFGRVLRGIRDDEIAVATLGKDVVRYKATVFVIGSFLAGIAGALYAHYFTFIDPSSFTPMESITILLMVVFGGVGNLKGPFVGAIIVVVAPELLRYFGLPSSVAAPVRQMLFGVLLCLLMLCRPQGLLGSYRFR